MIKSYAPLAFAVVTLLGGIYIGSSISESKFNKERLKSEKEITQLLENTRTNELAHKMREDQLLNEYLVLREEYENTLNDVNNDYNSRLQYAENRASIYKRQAESNPDCSSFIEHTSKLDRSLEEGRLLVTELSQIVRFQERQLDLAIDTIKNDRELLK